MLKQKLNEEMLDLVTGGTAVDNENKRIGVDEDHLDYTYEDLGAIEEWIAANVRNFPPATREQDIIDGLLHEELIAPL